MRRDRRALAWIIVPSRYTPGRVEAIAVCGCRLLTRRNGLGWKSDTYMYPHDADAMAMSAMSLAALAGGRLELIGPVEFGLPVDAEKIPLKILAGMVDMALMARSIAEIPPGGAEPAPGKTYDIMYTPDGGII